MTVETIEDLRFQFKKNQWSEQTMLERVLGVLIYEQITENPPDPPKNPLHDYVDKMRPNDFRKILARDKEGRLVKLIYDRYAGPQIRGVWRR